VASAAGLYVVGALLITNTLLLPHVASPFGAGAVGVTAMLTAAGLMLTLARDHGGLRMAFAAEMWGITVIIVLCASTGGARSPFSMLYFFAVGHAAAFQPRGRFLIAAAAGLLGYLASLLYTHIEPNVGAFAVVGVVLAMLTTGVVHIALERMREQRRRLELLIAATAKLDTSLDPQQTLKLIAATCLGELAELCVIDLIDANGTVTTTVAASLESGMGERVEARRRRNVPDTDHPVTRALQSRASVVVEEVAEVPALKHAVEETGGVPPRVYGGGYSGTVVPMVARGRMLGTISFVHRGRPVAGQLEVLEDLTGRAAMAYDNAVLYAERAHVAHTLRRSLMPAELPTIPGLELESYFRPMGSGNEVAGDFYDVFADGEACWLLVGDVCGKGAEAAVLTAFLRHTMVAYAREMTSPASVLVRVNEAMLEHDFEGRFATAILARLAFGESAISVTLASAGHPAALIARAGGGSEEFSCLGTLLGVFPDARVAEGEATLRPGDTLALYTDGLTEAQAPAHVLVGRELTAALDRSRPQSAGTAIGALLGLVDIADGARDDIAILAAHVPNVLAKSHSGNGALAATRPSVSGSL
jgi:hypothetical protein